MRRWAIGLVQQSLDGVQAISDPKLTPGISLIRSQGRWGLNRRNLKFKMKNLKLEGEKNGLKQNIK